jgi:hypothetical protein
MLSYNNSSTCAIAMLLLSISTKMMLSEVAYFFKGLLPRKICLFYYIEWHYCSLLPKNPHLYHGSTECKELKSIPGA